MKKFAIFLTLIYLVVFTLHTFVFAVNPPEPFTPDDNIQDPNCLPSDSNCYVSLSSAISALAAAEEVNVIDNGNYLQEWQWNNISDGTGLKLSSTSTLATGGAQKLFEVTLSGINANGSETTYAGFFSNTHEGNDSTNVGLYATASGGDNNYAIISEGVISLIGSGGGIVFNNIGSGSLSIGGGTSNVTNSFFFGNSAGQGSNADNSFFVGDETGSGATNADDSVFFGHQAGQNATNASDSNFIGDTAGANASNASFSNFFGKNSGEGASNASFSNFFGIEAGRGAIDASHSNFLGSQSGYQASNASYSNLFGYRTGFQFTGNDIGSNNIIIGTNISLPNATANAINIGGVLFGIGTYSTTTGNPSVTPVAGGRIGIGDASPAAMLTVGNGDLFQVASDGSIDAVTGYIQGSGTMSLTSANTTQTTTSSVFALNANSLTTGTGLYLASSSLTSGSLVDLAITGTGAVDSQKGINLSLSGANATGSQTSYGIYVSNTHSGTNPHNIGVFGTVANGSSVSAGVWGNNSASGYGVFGVSSSGTGVNASSTSGTGISASTTSGTYAGDFRVNPSSTNTIASVIGLTRFTSGTPSAGLGSSIRFNLETDGGGTTAAYESNTLVTSWSDATHATRTSEFYITGVNSGTTGTLMTLEGNGEVGIGTSDPATLLHLSASTANTGSAQSVLTVNAYSTGTPALGFGPGIVFTGESNGGPNDRDMVALNAVWEQSSVDASRTSALVFQNVSSAGALTERFRFTPSAMTTATSYTLGNSNNTITLGNTTYQVSATSSGVNVGGSAIFSPTNTSDMRFGKSLIASSGSATYTAFRIANSFNLTGTASGIMRGIDIDPGFTSLVSSYRAIDIQANHANAYGIYQSGASAQNYFAGEVGIANSSPGVALHVGSSAITDATTLLRLEDANSTCDFTADAGAPICGSDERLKKDIEELSTSDILSGIVSLEPVSYRWKTDDDDSPLQYGFIAQNVQEQFPNLVSEGTWVDGSKKLFLSMGGLMPYTVGAIKELNLKLTLIESFDEEGNSFGEKLRSWLANSTNRISRMFTGEICLTEPGEEEVCLNRSELKSLKDLLAQPIDNTKSNNEEDNEEDQESLPVPEEQNNTSNVPEVEESEESTETATEVEVELEQDSLIVEENNVEASKGADTTPTTEETDTDSLEIENETGA